MGDQSHRRGKTFRDVALFCLACVVISFAVPLPAELRMGLGILGSMGAGGFGLAWLFAPRPLAREAPDVLAELVDHYFECDGLCFVPTLEVIDGICWFNVYCQNRYERPCRAALAFIPMEGMARSSDQRSDVPPLVTNVGCDGGEVAVVRFPYPIASKWQGRIMIYDITGTVAYDGGRGRLIRSREGMPVRGPSSQHSDALRLAGVAALGLFGIVAITLSDRPAASCELQLPEGVADRVPPGVEDRTETLWELDMPTGGFPLSGPTA
jgi:hypothetical protein